jgi:hypothetical protein
MSGGTPDVWRRWAEVNTILIGMDAAHTSEYVTNAISGLTHAVTLAHSFPDIVQLLNLFFDYASRPDIFTSTKTCIEKLTAKLLLQAGPQVLIQLSHQSSAVSQFVHDLILKLLDEHFHELIFSVIVLTKSTNQGRSSAALGILDEFRARKPDVYDEVMLIRRCLVSVTVTWLEKVVQFIQDAFEYFQRREYDKMKVSLMKIVKLINKPPQYPCEMYLHFKKCYEKRINALEDSLKAFNPRNGATLTQISSWCKSVQDEISEELKRIHIILLSSISPELCEKTGFALAVPGTYRPGRKPIQIKYFVGQFSVFNTKQQPKDVVIRGNDGNFYQYLLKGHEDLRLDERIMQFFRLINSLVRKEDCFHDNVIQTVCVIPLSTFHGLVRWIPGTETLRNIVEQYRKLHRKDPMEEYGLAEILSYMSFDSLQPIQKMQVIEGIFQRLPDNDIADFFWLKAQTAEAWLKQVNTFAISTGMTSIVGYVIGLGDRHPSNLLVDKVTGQIIHIDFGDCFEKAALRQFLPEVVPFRLTRMMVKAMGASGVDGLFRSSFVNMSQLLRENHRVLVMVLAIFVQEPLCESDEAEGVSAAASGIMTRPQPGPAGRAEKPDEAVISSQEMTKKIRQKLTGKDFGEDVQLSVEEQATKLIAMATDNYNLSRMYSGWCPFW